jgi:phosphoribosylaminoimidazole-succinocarboxamide synthase
MAAPCPCPSSYDKQYVRDYLLSIRFDKKTGVRLPDDVIKNTLRKYLDVCRILTGKEAVL